MKLFDKPALLCVFADYFGLALIQPTLPFYLADISPDNVEIWVGAILSIQFVFVIPGNLVWGYLTDRLGSRRTLQLTIAGDALCFLATAFCTERASLLVVRACAGFCSPLVPALSYIFEIVPAQDAVKAMGRFGMCVMGAYLLGSGAIALFYDLVYWCGVNLIAVGVAVLGLLVITLTPVPPKKTSQPATGVGQALRSGDFLTHAVTGLCSGFMMNGVVSVAAISYKDQFGLSAAQVGVLFLGLPLLLMVVASIIVPKLVKALGYQKTVSSATICMVFVGSFLAVPNLGQSSIYSFSALIGLLIMLQTMQHQPNQVRVKLIGRYYTTNGSGIVTGASRTFWALGQAAAPVACMSGYVSFGIWFPWLLLVVLMFLLILFYIQQRVSLFSDPAHLPLTLIASTAESTETQETETGAARADLEAGRQEQLTKADTDLQGVGAWSLSAAGRPSKDSHGPAPALAPILTPMGADGMAVVTVECGRERCLQPAGVVDVLDSSESSDAGGLAEQAPLEAASGPESRAAGQEESESESVLLPPMVCPSQGPLSQEPASDRRWVGRELGERCKL